MSLPTCSAVAGAHPESWLSHKPKGTGGEPCLVDRVMTDFARNFGDQLTLRDIESASGYSVYQIIRAFRRRVGTTPHAYLMRMRVEYAANRLAQGDSIAGVAAEAGFADQSHMTRHFKRVFGTTPKQYIRATAASQRSPQRKTER